MRMGGMGKNMRNFLVDWIRDAALWATETCKQLTRKQPVKTFDDGVAEAMAERFPFTAEQLKAACERLGDWGKVVNLCEYCLKTGRDFGAGLRDYAKLLGD